MDLRLKIRINDLTEVQRTFKGNVLVLCMHFQISLLVTELNPLPDNKELFSQYCWRLKLYLCAMQVNCIEVQPDQKCFSRRPREYCHVCRKYLKHFFFFKFSPFTEYPTNFHFQNDHIRDISYQ